MMHIADRVVQPRHNDLVVVVAVHSAMQSNDWTNKFSTVFLEKIN